MRALLFCLLLLCSCATPPTRHIRLGMTQAEVLAVMGEPNRQHRTFSAHGRREQWVYGRLYLYFQDGKFVAWQD